MDKKHCIACGKLVSYGLRYGDMIFCNDECADRFGIDPHECFFGDVSETSDYQVYDSVPDDDYYS